MNHTSFLYNDHIFILFWQFANPKRITFAYLTSKSNLDEQNLF